MRNLDINAAVSRALRWKPTPDRQYEPIWIFSDSPLRDAIVERYADDPVKRGEFLKHLRSLHEDMTTFELVTSRARDLCLAFLMTEGVVLPTELAEDADSSF